MKNANTTYHVGNENFEIKIGSNPNSEFFLDKQDYSGVDPNHVIIKRVGDRIFLNDISSKNNVEWGISEFDVHGHEKQRVYESGKLLAKQWCEIIVDDIAKNQVIVIVLKGVTSNKQIHGEPMEDVPIKLDRRLFQSRPRLRIGTTPLDFYIKGKGRFCSGAYIHANPGTVTAIMGPSGCGKSTLLRMLTGYYLPTNSNAGIQITDTNGKIFDLQQDKMLVRDFLGYVPQGDVVFANLTPNQSLHYSLRLWSPQLSLPTEGLINYTCKRLGFHGKQFDHFLNTKMGSAEIEGGDILSGGQRRRANIAHSLVTQPLILILDEPTSGLSSVDSDQIIKLLQKLAKDQDLTIITTIHQPSREVFSCFDDLLLMTYGGSICYYGNAEDAVGYFEKTTGVIQGDKNPAEYLLERVTDNKTDSKIIKNAIASFQREKSVLSYLKAPLTLNKKATSNEQITKKIKWDTLFSNRITNCFILIQRNLRLMWSDKLNLALLFGQVPMITLLIFLAFFQFTSDEQVFDKFSQQTHIMNGLLEKDSAAGVALNPDDMFKRAENATISENLERQKSEKPVWIGQPTAQRRAAIYFLLIAACVWFGVMGACKEVVTEKPIIMREVRSYIDPSSYILSKISAIILIVLIQTGLLSLISGPIILELSVKNTLWLWAILWFTATSSAGLGLLISTLAPTLSFSLTMVPLIVIPQLIFGGLLRPEVNLEGNSSTKVMNSLTIQRWGFEAALAIDTYNKEGVLKRGKITWPTLENDPYLRLQVIQFENDSLVRAFFTKGGLLRPLIILFLMGLFFLIGSYFVLKWRFT